MRSPSLRILVNSVTITKALQPWTADASGGRQPNYGAASAAVACTVQPLAAETVDWYARQGMEVDYQVMFATDQGVHVRDRLNWVDGGGITLIVRGFKNEAGRFAAFTVLCKQVPTA